MTKTLRRIYGAVAFVAVCAAWYCGSCLTNVGTTAAALGVLVTMCVFGAACKAAGWLR